MVKILAILAVASFCATTTSGKLILEKVDTEPNTELVDISNNIHHKDGHTMLDVTSTLKKELNGKIMIYIDVFKKTDGEYKSVFVLTGQNICDHFEGTLDNALLTTIFAQLDQFGNIPKKCPIAPGPYNFKDIMVKEDVIPAMVPRGQYRVDLKVHDENDGAKVVYKETIFCTLT